MKRWKAAACAVLAGLMLAGCGSKEVISCRAEGPAAAVDLTQYVVKEAAYPAYPKEPRFEDYFDENGEGDWDAYDAAYTEYREALQKLGKLDAEPDGGAAVGLPRLQKSHDLFQLLDLIVTYSDIHGSPSCACLADHARVFYHRKPDLSAAILHFAGANAHFRNGSAHFSAHLL